MGKEFLSEIKTILKKQFDNDVERIIFDKPIIQYLVKKTKSANKGSKSRGSFANLYAIYVLIEDYINNGFNLNNGTSYSSYSGAKYTDLLARMRELPFGSKIQNHALNNRLNHEFKKYFPTIELPPIILDQDKKRYWFNEHLIIQEIGNKNVNLADSIIKIIDKYIEAKQDSMSNFITSCNQLKTISATDEEQVCIFIKSLLDDKVDARLFEIVSYSILKYYYTNIAIFFGFDRENIFEENLKLYKTGRTNANDGGIDFVMKPLGRFFQVTETTDFKKYFLDIDKIEKFPMTFVVKTKKSINILKKELKDKAYEIYAIESIVNNYLTSIEELINIDILVERLDKCIKNGYLIKILDEIILQSRVEFNFSE